MASPETLVAPDHAQRRLILLMEAGWSKGQLTRALGLTRKTLQSVLHGSTGCTATTASIICDTHLSAPPPTTPTARRAARVAGYDDAGADFWADDEPPAGTCARTGCGAPSGRGELGLCDAHNAAVSSRVIGWHTAA